MKFHFITAALMLVQFLNSAKCEEEVPFGSVWDNSRQKIWRDRDKLYVPSVLPALARAISIREYGSDDVARKGFLGRPFNAMFFANSCFENVDFLNCSFENTVFYRTAFYNGNFSADCDMAGAVFEQVIGLGLTAEQLKTTGSYKNKRLRSVRFVKHREPPLNWSNFSGVDFSGMDFTGSDISGANFDRCDFTNAVIKCCLLGGLTQEQIKQTYDYKNKMLIGIDFSYTDISGMDFSGFNLTDCTFGLDGIKDKAEGFFRINFSRAIITGCRFNLVKDAIMTKKGTIDPHTGKSVGATFETIYHPPTLTSSQIMSTWNYKTRNMAGIELPKYLQDELKDDLKEK